LKGRSTTIKHIHPKVDGKEIALTPTLMDDGSISWTWGWFADFSSHLKHGPSKGKTKKLKRNL
jgi:hypothetical protein